MRELVSICWRKKCSQPPRCVKVTLNTRLSAITMTSGGHHRGRAAMSRNVALGSQRMPDRRANSLNSLDGAVGADAAADIWPVILHPALANGIPLPATLKQLCSQAQSPT